MCLPPQKQNEHRMSKDEVWEVIRCALSLPLSPEQLDWLMADRRRADLFDALA